MKQGAFLPEATPRERAEAERQRREERRRKLALPCDFGLFGSDHLQTDLVDKVRTLAEVWAEEDRNEAARRQKRKRR